MSDIEGKKLLILGGAPMWVDIVKAAHALGVHSTVVDWHKDRRLSPAKLLADSSYDISIFDVDALLEVISKDKIDGVLTGYTDIVLEPYVALCHRAGLWCYGTPDQFTQLTDKSRFKELCKICSVPIIDGITVDCENLEEAYSYSDYPLVIKPSDSCGARGIRLVKNRNELSQSIDYAAIYSKSKRYIIEQFLDHKMEFMACYTICDGEIVLSALCDRFKSYEIPGFSAVPLCQYFPSIHIDRYLSEVDESVRRLANYIELKNCYLSIQGFVDSDRFYVNEAGFRLGGGQFYNFTEYVNGTNSLKRLIRYALTGRMLSRDDSLTFDNSRFDKVCGTVFVNAMPGVIHAIDGLDVIAEENPEVIHVMQQAQPGDRIESTGSLNHVIARIKIVAVDERNFAEVVRRVMARCRVTDSEGNSMLMKPLAFNADNYPLDGSSNEPISFSEKELL
ncbi:hypothetical protein [Thiocapsa rosea]|uniref:Biotin carboxylase n=1 Tax=Thiocapsa rosea TaxID=69360 RepID=A0A495V8E6_9GAMM|nr:hypothetical protein [Thiocapsa rosea]RKT45554.1 biotin carboxylase [Thiocapsa rosea]